MMGEPDFTLGANQALSGARCEAANSIDMKHQVLSVGCSVVLLLVMASAARAIPTTIETFENGDLSLYTSVNTGYAAVDSFNWPHDGLYALEMDGDRWVYRDDAAVQVSQGSTLSAWIAMESADAVHGGAAYFGFGSSAAGTLSFVLSPETGSIRFQENGNYGYTELAASSQSFDVAYYRAEVIWDIGGQLTGNLYGSDGITLLNSVTASSTLYSSGGIAFRGFSQGGSGLTFFDTVTVEPHAAPNGVPDGGATATLALLAFGGIFVAWGTNRSRLAPRHTI